MIKEYSPNYIAKMTSVYTPFSSRTVK